MSWWPGDVGANDIAFTNNGTLQGGATAGAAGFVGQAFSFDGTNNYVQIPNTPSLRPTNLTIECWVRFTAQDSAGSGAPAGEQFIVFKQNSRTSNFEGFDLGKTRVAGSNVFRFIVSSATGQSVSIQSSTLISIGVWYHVAAVRGSNFVQLYVNGALERQTNVSFAQDYGNFPLYFGTSGQAVWDRKLKGNLDEIALYNRALASNELAAIFAAGAAGKCKLPGITAQPLSQAVLLGSNVTFTVTATGLGALGYQWRSNTVAINGATNTSLTLSNVQSAVAADYSVVVTSFLGSTTSAVATLTVSYPPTITQHPQPVTVYVGEPFAFSAMAASTGPLNYQWQLNSANLPGETNTNLSRLATTTNDAGLYSLTASNAYGSVVSSNALLTVLDSAPIISSEPASARIYAGSDHSLQVSATGSKPLSYFWSLKGSPLPGATNATLSLSSLDQPNAGLYQVVVSNRLGTASSTGAVITVQSIVSWGGVTDVPLDLTNIVAISGNDHNVALRDDGTVRVWAGWESTAFNIPPDATNLVSVTAGAYHVLGIRSDGSQIVWGSNTDGQSSLPPGLGRVVLNAAGWYHSFAVRADGTPVHWGDADYGQAAIPVGLSNVVVAHSSDFQTLVAKADGTIAIWGASPAGNFPPPADLSNVVAVATGWSHSLAVKRDRTLVMWGANQFGQLGIPAAISNNVVAVCAIGNQSMALLASGHVIWWGYSQSGSATVPPGISNVMAIALGDGYAHALLGRRAPKFVQQPFSMIVPEGSSALLLGNALGTQPMTYQWRRHGTNLPGETLPSLMLNNLQVAHSDEYSLAVSNALGWAISSNSVLDVRSVLVTTQPTNRIAVLGSNVTFYGGAAGTPPIGLRWRKDGVELSDDAHISGANAGTLSISNVQTGDAGDYQFVATNSFAASTSVVATLTVIVPPQFVTTPSNAVAIVGSNATFSATVTGTAPLSLRWYFNSSPLNDDARHAGVTNSTLTISNVLSGDAGGYTLVAVNYAGAFTSQPGTLTVITLPAITTQPRGYSVPLGLPVTLSAAASGTAPLKYQWLLDGTPVVNATNASLVISNLVANQFGAYQFVVTNLGGAATSTVAQLTVGPVAIWGTLSLPAAFPLWPAPGLSNVIAVAGGGGYSLALRADGTLASWGIASTLTNIPAGLTDVVAISAGPTFALALRANGAVVAWGANTSVTNVPASLSNVIAIAAGSVHSVAVRADGSVAVWGGSLAGGQTNIPAGFTDVTGVSAGGAQTLALRQRGTTINWGSGDNTSVTSVPPPPGGLDDAVAVASGALHHLALRATGTMITWGDPTYPALVAMPAGLSNIVAVAASRGGSDVRQGQSLALRSNGTVVAWGNASGLGTNVPTTLSNAVAIAVGDYHELALVNNGRPLILRPPVGGTFNTGRDVSLRAKAVGNAPLSYQWFKDGNPLAAATNETLTLPAAQFSDAGNYHLVVTNALGSAQSVAVPVNLTNGAPALMSQPAKRYAWYGSPLSIGAAYIGSGPLSFQWLRNGQPFSAGTNELFYSRAFPQHAGAYQLIVSNAFGSATSSVAQITFTRVAAWGGGLSLSNAPADLNDVFGVAAGGFSHGLLLRSNGTVSAWGTSLNGTTNVPAGLSNVVSVVGGNYFSVALRSDGTAVAWGGGTSGITNIPASATNLMAVAAGASHALALRSNGTVVAWGLNTSSQTNVPASATNIVRISAGLSHSLALRADGTVITWGTGALMPTNLTGVVGIAAGYGLSAALKADGTVLYWDTGLKATVIPALTDVVALSSSGGGSQNNGPNTVALKSDGTFVAWGTSVGGQVNVPSDIISGVFPSAGAGFSLALLNDRSPAFATQPWDRQIAARSNVTLTAFAVGKPPLQYQWQFNGQPLAGGLSTSLTLSNVLPSQAGAYVLVAMNEFGATTSSVANVTVSIPQPTLLAQGALTNGFRFSFTSVAGVNYVVEYKNSLAATTWTELERRFGVGGLETVTDTSANGVMRFYRVRALFAPSPKLGAATWSGGALNFSFPTVSGAVYVVQYKNNLDDLVWLELSRQTGDGQPITVSDSNPSAPSRFYRVKVE